MLIFSAGMAQDALGAVPKTPKVILITGAFRGLGLKLAENLRDQGQIIVLAGRNLSQAPSWSVDNPKAMAVEMDMSDRATFQKAIDSVIARFGRIDAVVHNAGLLVMESAISMSPAALENSASINFLGPAALSQALLPQFQKQKFGRIIYLSSATTFMQEPGMAAYTSTKAAAEMYFNTLNEDIRRDPSFSGVDMGVSVMRLTFVRSSYEPTVVQSANAPSQAAMLQLMTWLRTNSPTTDYTVSGVILRDIQERRAPELEDVGIDGKVMRLVSLTPRFVQGTCTTMLTVALRRGRVGL